MAKSYTLTQNGLQKLQKYSRKWGKQIYVKSVPEQTENSLNQFQFQSTNRHIL